MVGPGTGVAPFRAFVQHRVLTTNAPGRGRAVLYFGCRQRTQDYLYGSLLEGWAAKGVITLHTAFSREQGHKIYVQDRLKQHGDDVWELLEAGGHFYVCGDGLHMAGAVEKELLEIVEGRQGLGPDAAKAYVESLIEAGRFQKDVWIT